MGPNKGAAVTILVKPGVYREQVSLPTSGALGFPFVFRATAPGVIIDGSDDFSTAVQWGATAGGEFLAASVNWTTTQVLIDGARLTPSTAAPGSLPANSFRYVAGQGLYVDFGGVNPGTHQVQVSHRNYGFTLSTKSFVTIDGFEITRTQDRGINIFSCTDLVIANNKVTFANSYGIQAVGSQNLVIEGNLVTDSNFHGIGLTSGTTAGTTGCTVRNNESARNAHPTVRQANGIYLSGASNNTIYNNRLHHNQDSGMHYALASNDNVSYNNISFANGDHGFDHLSSINAAHVHDVAYGNFIDGFSFEGNAPGGKVFNCISVDNGLTQNGSDLWVDAASSVGFTSDNNLLWNSTAQPPAKMGLTAYALVSDFALATGNDVHSRQANPLFVNAANADFHLSLGSPAIDAATSNAPFWPALDASGAVRLDDASVADGGSGPVTFADMGAFEYIPTITVGRAPVVVSPTAKIVVVQQALVTFTVTASDPDGDPITSLTMTYGKLPKNATPPTFVVSADKTSGTFTWLTPKQNGNATFTFIARNDLADTSTTQVQIKKSVKAPIGPFATASEYVDELALSSGFPMPSAGDVEFALSLPNDENVDWGIFDAQGRRVWSETRMASAGQVRLRWSGLDMSGRRAATGIYFARVRVGETEFVRRVVRF
jgi:parallel beta-helix repeat protein